MDENLIITNLYLFAIALVLAVMEIQIEGKNAWANALPTWKPKKGSLVAKIGSLLFGGKTFFTGYHLALNLLIILFLFLPFFFGYTLTLENILKTLSYYFILSVVWDFLWIVLNPHFGLAKWTRKDIWWFRKWLGPIPYDYLYGVAVSGIFLLPVINEPVFNWWIHNLLLFGLWITIVSIIAPLIIKPK